MRQKFFIFLLICFQLFICNYGCSYLGNNNARLISAVKNNNIIKVKTLLSLSPDLNFKGEDGNTVLHYAVMENNKEIVQLLINRGADVNSHNKSFVTPLMWAFNNQIIHLLLNKSANISAKDNLKRTPLHYMAFNGNINNVKILLDSGAEINAKDFEGKNPLHYAIKSRAEGAIKVIELMLDNGADVNSKSNEGITPLLETVQWILNDVSKDETHIKELVALLVNKGANVKAAENDGTTVLMIAAGQGLSKVVQYLINAGANINAKNIKGKTALTYAINNNHFETVKLLKIY